jgi:RHS repeat-associated protein
VGTSTNGCASPPTGATTYSFDANGDRTAAGSTSYTYNLAHRVTSATTGSSTWSYSYDGDRNRLSASDGTNTTSYLWDTNWDLPQLAMERDSSNNLVRRYVSDGQSPISMTEGGGDYYFLRDGLGSVVNVTSATGSTEWSYGYDPFGAARSTTKNDPSAPDNPVQFDGQLLDSSTGLYDLRARVYDPSSGSFLSPDPLQGLTHFRYAYAADNPIVTDDPSGESCSFWSNFNPFSGNCNFFYRAGYNDSFVGKAVQTVDPAYWAISGYADEVQSIESGCSWWNSVKHGLWGAVGGAATVGFAGLAEEGLSRLANLRWVRQFVFSLNRTSLGGRVITIGGGLLRYVGLHFNPNELPLHTRQIEFLWKWFIWRW